ncbi:MAG: extracellular solute-binding protein [Anaerolineales bacterium]
MSNRNRKPSLSQLSISFACLLTLLTLLSACQQNGTPPLATSTKSQPTPQNGESDPTPFPTETIEPMPTRFIDLGIAELENVSIEFWHVWSGSLGDVLQQFVDEFNAANEYGISVTAVFQGDISQRVGNAIGRGEPPNLVVNVSSQALAWGVNGSAITDLNAYVDDPIYGLSAGERADFYPVIWGQDVVGEKRLGIPMYRTSQLILYNATWARELGFEAPPNTQQAFREQACAAAQANNADDDPENDGTGGWFVSTNPSAIISWIFAFGGEVVTTSEYTFDVPETLEAFSFLKDLVDSGCAWQPEDAYPHAEFATRGGVLFSSSISRLGIQASEFAKAGNGDEWMAIPYPSTEGEPIVTVSGPAYIVLNATPEQQLASWIFIKWLISPENQARWAQASGFFPTRAAAFLHLESYAAENPQWASFREFLPVGKSEPQLASWGAVRWVVNDAAAELFWPGFSPETLPTLIEQLDATAAEVHRAVP